MARCADGAILLSCRNPIARIAYPSAGDITPYGALNAFSPAAVPPGGAAPKRWNWPCARARNTTTQLAMPQATAAAALPIAAEPPPPPPPQFMLEKRSAGRPRAAAMRDGSLRSLE